MPFWSIHLAQFVVGADLTPYTYAHRHRRTTGRVLRPGGGAKLTGASQHCKTGGGPSAGREKALALASGAPAALGET